MARCKHENAVLLDTVQREDHLLKKCGYQEYEYSWTEEIWLCTDCEEEFTKPA